MGKSDSKIGEIVSAQRKKLISIFFFLFWPNWYSYKNIFANSVQDNGHMPGILKKDIYP